MAARTGTSSYFNFKITHGIHNFGNRYMLPDPGSAIINYLAGRILAKPNFWLRGRPSLWNSENHILKHCD